jgi:hypothetical protein
VDYASPDLAEKMKLIGVDPKSIDDEYGPNKPARIAGDRAKISGQIKPCKFAGTPAQFCWDPHDGNGEQGPFPSREVAINTLLDRK